MENKNRISISLFVVFGILINLTSGCEKDEINKQDQLPVLTTTIASDISQTTASCGGNISLDGGLTISSRGVCWSTSANPTIANSKTTDGTGTGIFTSSISGLTANTTYYVKAYAINSTGTAYGNEISFATKPAISPIYNVLKVIAGKDIRSIIKTTDGGYIGIANSLDYDILKFDSNFNLLWNKTYGGTKGDYVESIIQTNDGGYLVIGETLSSDGNITLNHGVYDIWICKLDIDGNLIWQKSYGGTDGEGVSKTNSILQTNDGGYLFTGHTKSNNNDISQNHGGHDIWVVKISTNGSIEFEKTYGGSSDDLGRNLVKTNYGYALLTKVNSIDGDFNAVGNWVIQINETGNILWKTNLNGVNTGFINFTSDGGLVIVNTSFTDYSLSKLSSDGALQLSKTISFQSTSLKQPHAIKIMQTADGGFFIIGSLGNGNDADALLYRVAPDFSLLYNQIYKGNSFDMSFSLIPINANQYLYQFTTFSNDLPNITNSTGKVSVVIKLEEN
jgi:hypothetical protein